ncbi:MAG TPA: isoamylase early set domain-containing protein [Bacteroidota bacterium]|nr:isoamylase early set domain-containing protein [Bacteroidota bacterium]
MSLMRELDFRGSFCRVTFTIAGTDAQGYSRACVAGDVNDRDINAHSMNRMLGDGSFSITIELPAGGQRQFRYLLGNDRWLNEPDADEQIPGAFPGGRNSVRSL